MDIIECLLKLGSGVVNSMLETSKRYSSDERFTPEGREYYRELHEGLSIASNNLQDYQEKRKSSAFEKLDTDVSSKMKLSSYQNNVNALKARTLIEVYFGRFRGMSQVYFFGEEPTDENKYWVNDWKEKIASLKERYKAKYHSESFTPVLLFEGILFCEEGIGYGFNLNDEARACFPIPYKDIVSVGKRRKRNFLFNDEYYVWFEYANKDILLVANKWSFDYGTTHRAKTDLFVKAITDFIRCLNPNCAIQEKN